MLEKNSSNVFNKNSEERRRKQTKFLFVGLLFVIVLMVLAIALLRKPQFQIQKITIQGTEAINPEDIHQFAEQTLSGNYLWVIPKTTVFLFSKHNLEKNIANEFSSLEKTTVTFHDTQEIIITIHEKKPSYVWCEKKKCFFIDREGVIFKEAPIFNDGVYLTFEGGSVSDVRIIGSSFIAKDLFMKAQVLVDRFQQMGIDTWKIQFQEAGDIAFRISSIHDQLVGEESRILVSGISTMQQIQETLGLLLEDDSFKNDLRAKGQRLQTIDLRFDGKIYYKFSDGL